MNLTITLSVLLALVLYEPLRWLLIRLLAITLVSSQWIAAASIRRFIRGISGSRLWRDAATQADLLQEQAKQ